MTIDSSRWWYLTASALTVGVLLLPFARVPWTVGSSVSGSGASVVWAFALVSVGLSASLYLDARRIGSRDWRPNPRLYAVGGALYPLSLVVGAWYLSERQWHVGLIGAGDEPPSEGGPVASRWHYWIALGPVWCLVGAVAAVLPLGLAGLLIGAFC